MAAAAGGSTHLNSPGSRVTQGWAVLPKPKSNPAIILGHMYKHISGGTQFLLSDLSAVCRRLSWAVFITDANDFSIMPQETKPS